MNKNFRRGIAMIELIFAMVIIGIALLSAPMLIQQSIQSSNVALQQESIAAISTHLGIVMSKHWDEADTNNTEAPILALTGNSGDFNISTYGADPLNTNIRVGMRNVIARNSADTNNNLVFISTGAFGTPSEDNDTGEDTFDDIDDYNNQITTLSSTVSSPTGDYIDNNISISTTVTYGNDSTVGAFDDTPIFNNIFNNQNIGTQSHIKFVSVRLTTSSPVAELEKNITMSAFSCNVGTYRPQGKVYQ